MLTSLLGRLVFLWSPGDRMVFLHKKFGNRWDAGMFFFSLCAIIPWKYHGNILWTSLNSKYPLFLVDQHQFDVRLGALPHSGAGSPGGIWIPIDVMWVTFPDILYLDSVYDFC